MMKLKPCTMLLWASDDNVTNGRTPTTAPTALARSTEIDGSSLAGPDPAPAPHACVIAFCVWSFASQPGGLWAGETTWPLVTSQPDEATNQPVPVSRNGEGVTVASAPAPQRTSTSPPTSETTRATAGFARSNAS